MITWRKIRILTGMCVCLFCFAGCSVTLPFSFSAHKEHLNPDAYIAEFLNRWHYRQLSEEMQACYGTIYTALTDSFEKDSIVSVSGEEPTIGIAVSLPYTLEDSEQAQKLYNAFFYDNPQFFYVNNLYGLEGYEHNSAIQYNTILLTYTMDVDTRSTARTEVDNVINTILNDVPNTTDEYVTEMYLHEQLLKRCTYDYTAAQEGFDTHPHAYSVYGALVKGKAVCEGYSRAMQLLFNRCDIDGTLVTGKSVYSEEEHMWNYVTINEKNYHLDATWNDSTDTPRNNYFNVTTEQILLSHHIDDTNTTITRCTAIKDNYYVRNGLYINTYRRQDIAAVIAERIKAGSTQIELLFAEDKFDSALLFLKNRRAAEEQINPHLANTEYILWNYRLTGEMNEHILCITKEPEG